MGSLSAPHCEHLTARSPKAGESNLKTTAVGGGEPPTVSRKVSVHSQLDRCEQEKLETGLWQKAGQEMGSLGCVCLQGSPRHRAWGRGASYPRALLIFLGGGPWGRWVVSGGRGVAGAKTGEGEGDLTSCPLGHRLLPGTR